MASSQDFVDYVCEQARLPGRLSFKKMFGEYALYVDGKVVALVCDNQVFVKPTEAGRQLLRAVVEAPPYPGAKPHYQVTELLDDHELFSRLLLSTVGSLPTPKPKPGTRSSAGAAGAPKRARARKA